MQKVVILLLVLLAITTVLCVEVPSQAPLVSLIIPTYERQEFLKQAIQLIERQDYPNLEVIIVDDSAEAMVDDILQKPFIKYIHLEKRISIGAKRNIAVTNAKGSIIAHWDDDDYFRPHRIREQVAPIINGEADMSVLEHHYYFHLPTQTFFTVKRASSWGPHFATFVYRKSLFDQGIRYPDSSMAEDYYFAESALNKGARITVLNNEDGKHVYLRHHNTWEFNFKDFDAEVEKVDPPSFISKEDVKFYANVKSNPLDKPPKHYASEEIKWNRPELHPSSKWGVRAPRYSSSSAGRISNSFDFSYLF